MATPAKKYLFESAFDTYTEVGIIGHGGSGTVLHVKNEYGSSYALKYLSPQNVTTQKLKRFKNELSFCEKNTHPNILTIIDSGFIAFKRTKCPFYVMPLFKGTLRDLMKEKIPVDKILPLFSVVLNGVEAAHKQKIWHRDLKPENILHDTANDQLVVADFGIAHFEEDFLHTMIDTEPHERLANFQYAAPEQRQRGASVDHKADIYALGLILNEMFTKNVPIGTNYKKIGDVTADYKYLDSLVELMLSNSPERRPDNISAIKKELIAKGNQFIIEQKLSNLKKTVIPRSEIDDPLVISPPQVKEVDYNDRVLILKLDQIVNNLWVGQFHNPRQSYSCPMGLGPDNFHIQGNIASVRVEPDMSQKAVDQFKIYADWANHSYKREVQRDMEVKEKQEKEQLRIKIKKEEERQDILKNIKI